MNESPEDLIVRLQREELERIRGRPPEPVRPQGPTTIHYTQLPDAPPDSPLATEWNIYRRVLPRLLGEGQEGKWLLIKHEEIIGIWDTEAEAGAVRLERFLMQPVLVKQVLAQEPILRIGYNRLCPS
jgi:hypothetical protein